ncbi:sporulation protein YjcZ [Chengkuizengella sediminis]|nr:sporulation protein YjcZ [Chengkuizengella sediminis]NDI35263.1 sporulation protein YjcZ [Chengkuizengella sediminis]
MSAYTSYSGNGLAFVLVLFILLIIIIYSALEIAEAG